LAFTIFRDEFDLGFVLMFGFLLFTKSFHWLASDRVEWVITASFIPTIFDSAS
jgi:E3 ubiquitin-protein ligase synoviolin